MKVWLDRLFYQEHHKGERLLFGAQKVSLATPSKTPFHMTCKEGQFDVANFLILEKWPKNVDTVHRILCPVSGHELSSSVCNISGNQKKKLSLDLQPLGD